MKVEMEIAKQNDDNLEIRRKKMNKIKSLDIIVTNKSDTYGMQMSFIEKGRRIEAMCLENGKKTKVIYK